MLFFAVEKFIVKDRLDIRERQKQCALAAGLEWIEPEERLRLEQEQADREADEARRAELEARCKKKGLNFEEEEEKYQAKRAAKIQAAKARKARKNKDK